MIRVHRVPSRVTALLLVGVLSACGSRAPAASADSTAAGDDSAITVTPAQRGQIQTVTVSEQAFNPTIITTGTVNFNGDKSTSVIPAISGPVSRILVEPGDQVVPGQPLAWVASPDFAADVADYRKSESALRNAQRIETLDEKLFAGDALARADLDQARSDLSAAQADRDAARTQLLSLGIDSTAVAAIEQGKEVAGTQAAIRAPIAGTVVEKLITPGQLLQAGAAPAFTIADLSSVWVMGNAFESDIGSVSKGQPAIITTDASTDSFPGRVDYVGAMVDPDSKATQVRIVVPNRDQVLKQNMLVSVSFRGSKARRGMVIPVSAVLRDEDNLPFVYLDAGNNRFNRRRITLGGRAGNAYEVSGGLAVGDKVVVQGALYLQEAGAQ
ncbi:MAG TPA: efflux RND transporter periplasmic adaptor subunit [Gemmatimonadales bacterium]|jgi:cobalt-zinc-cadmium efflux system membrane fusion protein